VVLVPDVAPDVVPAGVLPTGVLPTGDSTSMALLLANLKEQVKSALSDLGREATVAKLGPDASERAEDARADLKKALDEIGREERTIDERLRPRTLAQIEELEAKFDQAQAELKRLKAQLKKK